MHRHAAAPAHSVLRAIVVGATAGFLSSGPGLAQAQFYVYNGSVLTTPIDAFPIDANVAVHDLRGRTLIVGNGSPGSFSALAGAQLRVDAVNIATDGTGSGDMNLIGPGARLDVGSSQARLVVGSWGNGSLEVAGGAQVDATLDPHTCVAASDCWSFVGLGAGSNATLTVTGAGSEVRTVRGLIAGFAAVMPGLGTPGGTTNATVNVLDGGTLRTETANLGSGPQGPDALGTERTNATVVVDGAGSRWVVTRSSVDNNEEAYLRAARHANAAVDMTVRNGGSLVVDGVGAIGPENGIILGQAGGRASLTVTGAGSTVRSIGGHVPFILAGETGEGSFSVLAGATAEAMIFVAGNRAGGRGELLIDGVGSQLTLSGVERHLGPHNEVGAFAIGDNPGSIGEATVRNGGRMLATDGGADSRGVGARPAGWVGGTEAGVTRGVLRIEGSGSTVEIVGNTLGLGAGVPDNSNPLMVVGGYAGNQGELFVTGGGRLQLTGHAVSTVADPRNTLMVIGGRDDVVPGGTGSALISGAGSELRVIGSDGFIVVGRLGNGSLTIRDQGRVETTIVSVGRGVGSNGSLVIDNGRLDLSGQWTGSTQSGAALGFGSRGGTGTGVITNGSVVDITNFGASGATLNLGGSALQPLGHGTLALSLGSRISLSAAPGLATLSVGRDGSGVLTMDSGSSIDVGAGNTYIGRLANGTGAVVLNNGSRLRSAYVGVGSEPNVDGGVGTLLVGTGSVVAANTVEVGTRGLLGGSGGTVQGNVIVRGVVAPGASPGRLTIDGGVTMQPPGRLVLEVQGDGLGHYQTDQIVLIAGSSFDLANSDIEFRFLGDTDPNAFIADGLFDMDGFLRWLDGQVETGLSTAFAPGQDWNDALSHARFSATSNAWSISQISLQPDGRLGAIVAAIPEPPVLGLVLGGLALLLRRRQRAPRRVGTAGAPAAFRAAL